MIEELDKRIFKNLKEFNLRAGEINHLIGICRKEEGREFLDNKIYEALTSLKMVRCLIDNQFHKEVFEENICKKCECEC